MLIPFLVLCAAVIDKLANLDRLPIVMMYRQGFCETGSFLTLLDYDVVIDPVLCLVVNALLRPYITKFHWDIHLAIGSTSWLFVLCGHRTVLDPRTRTSNHWNCQHKYGNKPHHVNSLLLFLSSMWVLYSRNGKRLHYHPRSPIQVSTVGRSCQSSLYTFQDKTFFALIC